MNNCFKLNRVESVLGLDVVDELVNLFISLDHELVHLFNLFISLDQLILHLLVLTLVVFKFVVELNLDCLELLSNGLLESVDTSRPLAIITIVDLKRLRNIQELVGCDIFIQIHN